MTTLKRTLALCLISMLAVSAWAVPAYRGWRTVTQPDGTTVTIRQMGDEFFHYWENEEGQQMEQDAEGWWRVLDVPAVQSERSKQKQASRSYNRKAPGIQKAAGQINLAPRGLVILVNFTDVTFKSANTKEKMSELMNSENYTYNSATGSVREYFKAQSNGAYVPDFDVVGPYTVQNNRKYYGENEGGVRGEDKYAGDMIVEACKAADADGVDFTLYNNDGDSYVDFVYVIYAGVGEADANPAVANAIWPHNWTLSSARYYGNCTYSQTDSKVDGLYINNYACSGELEGTATYRCPIGTIAHEFGHVLGLPDYYVTSSSAPNNDMYYTPGAWHIMDYGSYNNEGRTPPNYSPHDKLYFGWYSINTSSSKFLAKDAKKNCSLTTSYGSWYQITGTTSSAGATSTNRVWYLEYRQKSGWDQYLPGHGMVVWEVQYNSSNWTNNTPNNSSVGYTLVTANSQTRPYEPCVYSTTASSTSGTPFPGTSHITSYTPATGCALTEITESSGTITFKYNGGEDKTRANYEFVTDHCSAPADGDVAINAALSVTITPNSGYTLDDASCWTVEMGGVELTYGSGFTYNASTNTFYIASLTDDVVIMAEAKLIRTVTWSVQGNTSTTTFADGAALVLPSTPADCSGESGKKFVGWTTSSTISGSAPSDLFTAAGTKTVTANTTYYAVYATASGSGGSTTATYGFEDADDATNWDISAAISKDAAAKSTGTYGGIINTNHTYVTYTEKVKVTNFSFELKRTSNNSNYNVTVETSSNGTDWTAAETYTMASFANGSFTQKSKDFDGETALYVRFHCYNTTAVRHVDNFSITYGGSASYSDYSLTCTTCTLSSIALNTSGATTVFTQGDAFSAEGLVVTASYSDCANRTVSPTSVSSPDMSTTGVKTITVSYTEGGETKSQTYNITVNAAPTYKIRFYDGDTKLKEEDLVNGATATPPTNPAGCSEYTFYGWWTEKLASSNTTAHKVTDFTVSGAQDYYAVYSHTTGSGGSTTATYGFEDADDATNWDISAAISKDAAAKSTGTYGGIINTNHTYVTYTEKVKVTNFSFELKRTSNNSNYNVTVETSSNGTDWTAAETYTMGSFANGSFTQKSKDFDGETALYVRFHCNNTTAVRHVDNFSITYGGGGTTYYTGTAECVECTNNVTLTKGTPEHGSFNLDKADGAHNNCSEGGLVVSVSDITPAEGYEFGAITQTGIASGVTIDQAGKTVTYAKDVTGGSTINVTFTPKTTYAIRFFNNGEQVGATQNLYAGQTAVKPSPDPTACTGYTFVGWWTAELAEDNTTAETWVTDFTVSGAQDYYAVYSHVDGEGGGGSSTVTFAKADFSGSGTISASKSGVSVSCVGNIPSSAAYVTFTEGNTLTISSTAGNITAIDFTCSGDDYTGNLTDVSDISTSSWSISVNNPGAKTTVRVSSIVVTIGGGSSTTYYTTEPDCVECLNKVTIEKGEENNGTFSLDKDGMYDNCKAGGLVVHVTDIEPSEDYQFKEITQEGIDAGVTIDNDAKTVTYDKDVAGTSTINVVFEHKPTYTIRFYNGESLIGSTQTVTKDKTPSVPANPTACDGYTFVGWWTSSLPANNTESHAWVSDFTATGNQDYYAVYRHNEGGSGSGNVSFVSSDLYTNGAEATAKTIDGVTFTFDQGDNSSNAPRYYSSGTSVRMYADNTLTISAESSITAIAFTFGGTTSAGLDANTGTYNAGSWSGEATSITFTAGASGQQHIQSILVTVDGGGTAHYTSVFSCSGHTITVAEVEHGSGSSDKSRCDEGGAVTITLTADEGYECGGITTLPVVATTQMAECTYTFSMPDADITVTPVFTPKTPRTFTFEKGTGICATNTLTEAVWNGGVTLPTATANSGCDPEYVFAGWAKAAVTTETEVRPTLYAAGTLYNGEETTLYAVYSQTTGGSASGFTLSYTIDDITYYVAARTGTNKYMGATTDVVDAARFTIVTSNDKQYLCWHGENDTYVSNNSNKTDLLFTTNIENAYSWDITETGNTIALVASSGRHFMFNTNIAQRDRFAAYSTDDVLVKGDAGTTVYNTNPSCICYSVNITYNANGGTLAEGCGNVVGGECERDWKLCDAPTREGYLFTNWKDQNGTLYNAGAMVQDLKLSLTLTAQWIPAPYTVLFDAGTGTCVESLTEPSRGDGITLPKAEPSAACADDWTFVGWSATELVGETNTTATIIGVAGVPYVPATNNVTLYAVYSTLDEAGATSDYTRVSASTPEEGDYAIVVSQSDESFGLLTYGTISKGRLAYTKAYTSLPASTISSPAATQIWHLTYDASGYAYLYNANAGAYLSASGTNIDYNANGGSAFVLTRDPGTYGDYQCLNSTASASSNYYLGANKDADYVRYYGTSNIIATNSVTLYAGSTGMRYYATSPVCTPCTDPEWSFELGTSVVKTKGSAPFTNTVIKVHESSGSVTYSSTNEAVATIDAAGEVTLVGTGSTTITLRLTKAMPYCAAVLQYELEVKEPSIDIVGVTPDGEIVIEHDLEGTITLDLSEGQAISTGTAANDLFFSKYFEAASNMKLFAIFNGTGHDMDISNIRVRCNCTTDGKWPTKTGDLGYVELRTISKLREQYPKLKIPSGTELIFWSNNKGSTSSTAARNTELRECIAFIIGEMEYHYSDMEAMEIPNWFCLGDYTTFQTPDADGNNQFVFNGDDSMIMERYNPATGQWEAIDLFGAGTSEYPADTDGLVEKIETKYIINGVSQELNDGTGFHELCTDSIIPFSTNRYMLVRKNTVLDGMHAVASNTSSFATLCEEWNGTPVGGSADGYCRSGNVFSDIAEYDYAENYIDWTGINDDAYTVTENADGTVSVYFNTPLDLDARACSLLKIEVRDKDDASKILATTEYKIPIVVKAGEVMTSADLFHDQGDKCATCDVAILGSATLTKATDGATNDMPEVRDIYVYGGGQLVIPSGTHYRAHDLIMRMEMAADKVNVNVPNIQAIGSLSNQYGGAIRQQVRVGTSRFYQFAVPYPVRLEDVTFSDGRPAIYGEDFMIRYYDGESRAQNLGTASNWRNFEGTELQPGVGYTLAVAKKAGHEQRELIFPMADASLAEGEPATKTTAIHAWGDNTIRANHRGWNFLSNPYLTTYGRNNLDDDAGGVLTTGRLVEDPDHPGWWISDAGTIPYVTLINGTRTDYTQERVALQDLPPFTTFFIQAGDDTHNSGEESTLTFNRDHRATSAPAYMRAEQKAPVTHFGVLLNGNNATDNCGMAIGEDYSAAYDMQADLSKEFGSAYSLKLYTLQEDAMRMAFLATHPDSLNKPIPVGVRMPANAEYTFSIDRRYNLGAFAHIYLTDNVTGQHTDLLEDTYSFAGTRSQNDARFSLFVVVKKNIPTGTDNLLNGIYAVGREGAVMLTGLPETADIYIYDMNGRLVLNRHTHGATSVTYHMPIGVYQIRIHSEGANALLRTIVH